MKIKEKVGKKKRPVKRTVGKIFLLIIVCVVSIPVCFAIWGNYEDAVTERNWIIWNQNKLDSIAKLLFDKNDSEIVDKAEYFCSEYDATNNLYSQNKKLIEKNSKNLTKQKQEKEKLVAKNKKADLIVKKQNEIDLLSKSIEELENQNLEYAEYLEENKQEYYNNSKILQTVGESTSSLFELINNNDLSFYYNYKVEIKERYKEYVEGTVKPFEIPEPVSQVPYIILEVLIVLIALTCCVLIFVLPIILRNKKIKEIAIILYKIGDVSATEKVLDFVNFYEQRKNKIDELNSKKIKTHNKKKSVEIDAKIMASQSEIDGKEQQYYSSKVVLEHFSKSQIDLYNTYKNEVIACYEKLLEEGKLKEIQLEQERKVQMQQEIEQHQKAIAQRDEEDEISDKREILTRTIKELKEKISLLQNEVDKNGSLQREFLQNITNSLEKIEDNKLLLDEQDKKILKRNSKILFDTFEKANNISDFQVNVDIIKEIFEGIL